MNIRRTLAVILAIGTLPFYALAHAENAPPVVAEGSSAAGPYCVRPIGDFNGDSLIDYAVSAKRRIGPLIVYIFLDGIMPAADIDPAEQAIGRQPVVLKGPFAAPYVCSRNPVPGLTAPKKQAQAFFSGARAAAQAPAATGRPPAYILVDLSAPAPYPSAYPVFNAINVGGHAVGQLNGRAVWFDGAQVRDLGTLGGDSSEAFGINRNDRVVGGSLTGQMDDYGMVTCPFLHDGLQMTPIETTIGSANDIDDTERVVGGMWIDADPIRVYRGFFYTPEGVRDLGTLGGDNSEAHAINAAGQVVGEADTVIDGTDEFSTRAFVYENGALRDLAALGHACYVSDDEGAVSCFEQSVATDINTHGAIVGFSSTEDGGVHSFVIENGNGPMTDLGTLGGYQSWAYAINDSGQIVGTSLNDGDAAYVPFVVDQGVMYNLKDLIVDLPDNAYVPSGAYDINNFGQIVGPYMMLDPIYEEITPGGELVFDETLGREFKFEYWMFASGDDRPQNRWGWAGLQVRIELVQADGVLGRPGKQFLNRWLTADRLLLRDRRDVEWRPASIRIPDEIQGRAATIRLRSRQSGFLKNSTVFLRHFDMAR